MSSQTHFDTCSAIITEIIHVKYWWDETVFIIIIIIIIIVVVFTIIIVDRRLRNCPSARWPSVADAFRRGIVLFNGSLFWLMICLVDYTGYMYQKFVVFVLLFSLWFIVIRVADWLFHVFSLTFLFCPHSWPCGCCVSTSIINYYY